MSAGDLCIEETFVSLPVSKYLSWTAQYLVRWHVHHVFFLLEFSASVAISSSGIRYALHLWLEFSLWSSSSYMFFLRVLLGTVGGLREAAFCRGLELQTLFSLISFTEAWPKNSSGVHFPAVNDIQTAVCLLVLGDAQGASEPRISPGYAGTRLWQGPAVPWRGDGDLGTGARSLHPPCCRPREPLCWLPSEHRRRLVCCAETCVGF